MRKGLTDLYKTATELKIGLKYVDMCLMMIEKSIFHRYTL